RHQNDNGETPRKSGASYTFSTMRNKDPRGSDGSTGSPKSQRQFGGNPDRTRRVRDRAPGARQLARAGESHSSHPGGEAADRSGNGNCARTRPTCLTNCGGSIWPSISARAQRTRWNKKTKRGASDNRTRDTWISKARGEARCCHAIAERVVKEGSAAPTETIHRTRQGRFTTSPQNLERTGISRRGTPAKHVNQQGQYQRHVVFHGGVHLHGSSADSSKM
ncbi:unnamed protein product, partial [Phaeothamnion confervicola]